MNGRDVASMGAIVILSWHALAACGDDATGNPARSRDAGSSVRDSGTAHDAGTDFCRSDKALDLSVCDPKTAKFSIEIDNPFYPLVVGQTSVFEGEEDGEKVHLEIEVLDETETVAGVETRIIEEREQHDGSTVEVSRNFFAQGDDGTVCYFGEDVDIYEMDKIISHDGAWRAEGKNRPGIVMPPSPKVGDFLAQEDAPKVAEDRAEVHSKGTKVTVPPGEFADTLETEECTPLEPGVTETKYYARGVGLIVDGTVELISY